MASTRSGLPAMFTYAQARAAGVSKHQLYKLRDAGRIELISRGVYRRTNTAIGELELIEIALRSADATLCLASALVRHELADEIPGAPDIALPRGTRPPKTTAPVKWHFFEPSTFSIGRTELKLNAGARIGLYSPERSIVDAFRARGREGHELANEALKRWLRQKGSQPAVLLRLAAQFPRVEAPIRKAMEVLL